jgi:hypothetical protein
MYGGSSKQKEHHHHHVHIIPRVYTRHLCLCLGNHIRNSHGPDGILNLPYLPVFDGISGTDGQKVFNDLWVLDMVQMTWHCLPPRSSSPPEARIKVMPPSHIYFIHQPSSTNDQCILIVILNYSV